MKDDPGDSFYVRAMFDRQAECEGELSFKQGDILFVENTVCNGDIGLWKAWLVDDNGNKLMSGSVLGRARWVLDLLSTRELYNRSVKFTRLFSGH